VKSLPQDLAKVELVPSVAEAVAKADAIVVCTEWPEFRQVAWAEAIKGMSGHFVLDANRFLEKELRSIPGIEHVSVGVTADVPTKTT
jgi:UDPglucose 6-dehydrogenase